MRSLSEIETAVKRASRAVGYSWGNSEEVGKSIRQLELFGFQGIKNLNRYYKDKSIKKLYEKLLSEKNNLTIAQFLSVNSELRHVVRRAFIIEKFPYSEIQDNTISKNIVPIDMLRLKLSFFGALKFDPRSDKWLRICMFQGAPLPNELKNYDEQWVYKTIN